MFDMTPQHFPLHCMNEKSEHFIVLGWTPRGSPVVVRETWGHHEGAKSEPEILDGPLRYRLPEFDASVSASDVIEVRRVD